MEGQAPQITITDTANTTNTGEPSYNGGLNISSRYDNEGLPKIDCHDRRPVAELLREHAIPTKEESRDEYWTFGLLQHIITDDRIRGEFHPKPPPMPLQLLKKDYLRIFAILALIDKISCFNNFVQEGVRDDALPLAKHKIGGRIRLERAPGVPVHSFDGWPDGSKDQFCHHQPQVTVPFFDLGENYVCKEYTLPSDSIRPWYKIGSAQEEDRGGYARVCKVRIHPTSHDFDKLLHKMHLQGDFFAIKTLLQHRHNETMFQQEFAHLKRFSGHTNRHLIIALAAFSLRNEWSFIFPRAECDLARRMESNPPPYSWNTRKWASEQLAGLSGALGDIHNPARLGTEPGSRYGRHGDLKCDNILCFRSMDSSNEVLVISDFGLSVTNGSKSRSNIPNKAVPQVPGYRPPECDIEGGTISRAFDVWTLGCLYLDFMTWLLGGPQLLREFRERRTSVFINGAKQDIFFEFQRMDDLKVARVKPTVTEWIQRLRQQQTSSRMVHDILSLIEDKMLVVLARDRKRSSAKELRNEFDQIRQRCAKDPLYGMQSVPSVRRDVTEQEPAVEVELNENARVMLSAARGLELEDYVGSTRRSLTRAQLENIDGNGDEDRDNLWLSTKA